MYRIAIAAALILCLLSWVGAAPDPDSRAYVLTLDGESFPVAEGATRGIVMKDGTRHTVRVQMRATQPLRVGAWTLVYPSTFSVDRDEDGDLTLMNGAGIAIVVVDHGAGDLAQARTAFAATMREYERIQRLGVAKDLRVTGPVEATLSGATVLHGTLEHTDEDGDRRVLDMTIVHSKVYAVNVMTTYDALQAAAAKKATRTVLDSLGIR